MKSKRRPIVRKLLEWMSCFKASDVTGVCSTGGQKIEGFLVMCPLLMEQMVTLNKRATLKAIIKAGELASQLGTKIVGLGAYAALLGNHGLDIAKKLQLPVTTGNAYTLAMIPEAILRAAASMGVDIEKSKILVIGAGNNIGRTCVEVLKNSADTLILISRSQEKLNEIINRCKKKSRANIRKSDDIQKDASEADIIIYASNLSSLPFNVDKLKSGVIIFDSSYPRKINPAIRNDILVIDGVAIRPPGDPEFHFDFGLPPGLAFPCMAEPMILAFENRFESYSLGREMNIRKVMEILRVATKHGFRVAELTSAGKVLPKQQIEKIKNNISKKEITKLFSLNLKLK